MVACLFYVVYNIHNKNVYSIEKTGGYTVREIRLKARAKINLTLDVTGKREDGLTKRGISRKMGTYVRILPRNADGMKTVKSNDERKEEEMAFSCVLYLKEECDGCGIC